MHFLRTLDPFAHSGENSYCRCGSKTLSELADCIIFEQPLNERVRSFLRLEFLFKQLTHHKSDHSEFGYRATLSSMLDLYTLLSRSDLKGELLKELSDQRRHLEQLKERPDVDSGRLDKTLDALKQNITALQKSGSVATGGPIRESGFLTSILNRSAIPGGTCDFDLPAYHHWLNQSREARDSAINSWLERLEAIESGVTTVLNLIRHSNQPVKRHAEAGVYFETLDQPCQLLRIAVRYSDNVYPEISAGKHRFTIRLMIRSGAGRKDYQADRAVDFWLTHCNL